MSTSGATPSVINQSSTLKDFKVINKLGNKYTYQHYSQVRVLTPKYSKSRDTVTNRYMHLKRYLVLSVSILNIIR